MNTFLPNGGSQSAVMVTPPGEYSAVEYGTTSFVVFNQNCCADVIVDGSGHLMGRSISLLASNSVLNVNSDQYGASAYGINAGMYFALISTAYVGDETRMSRCIRTF